MTLGTNSSLGALRTEAVTGWELCQPENFPESSKLASIPERLNLTLSQSSKMAVECEDTTNCHLLLISLLKQRLEKYSVPQI